MRNDGDYFMIVAWLQLILSQLLGNTVLAVVCVVASFISFCLSMYCIADGTIYEKTSRRQDH